MSTTQPTTNNGQQATEKKLIPILYSPAMVQAKQAGRKTETRRICKHQYWSYSELVDVNVNGFTQKKDRNVSCPYGKVGDVLWTREEHYRYGKWVRNGETKKGNPKWKFVAVNDDVMYNDNPPATFRISMDKTNPGIPAWHKRLARFMPKALCRMWDEITSITVEPLHEITEAGALAEGIIKAPEYTNLYFYEQPVKGSQHAYNARASYLQLWEKINGVESYDANPWVWVIKFKPTTNPALQPTGTTSQATDNQQLTTENAQPSTVNP